METSEALAIVKEYQAKHGLSGTLEALMAMQADKDLTHRENAGYAVTMHGFNRLFNGEGV